MLSEVLAGTGTSILICSLVNNKIGDGPPIQRRDKLVLIKQPALTPEHHNQDLDRW